MDKNLWIITPETEEEILAVNDLLIDMRAKKQYEELVQKCKMAISFEISDSIDKIGLEETKNIVRQLARELRNPGLNG